MARLGVEPNFVGYEPTVTPVHLPALSVISDIVFSRLPEGFRQTPYTAVKMLNG